LEHGWNFFRSHTAIDIAVYGEHRSNGATTYAPDLLKGKPAVQARFTGANPKIGPDLIDELAGTFDITGGAHADTYLVTSGRMCFEKIVKADNPMNFAYGKIQVVGNASLRIRRNISHAALDFLENRHQIFDVASISGNNAGNTMIRFHKLCAFHVPNREVKFVSGETFTAVPSTVGANHRPEFSYMNRVRHLGDIKRRTVGSPPMPSGEYSSLG
jgi:hypothetical protein